LNPTDPYIEFCKLLKWEDFCHSGTTSGMFSIYLYRPNSMKGLGSELNYD